MKRLQYALMFLSAALLIGCDNKAEQGPAGPPGSGRIVSSMFCEGTISGLGGAQAALNGLQVEYNAVLTSSGDVYATANIIDDFVQVSGTAFYAAAETGASSGAVLVTDDVHSTGNGGYWRISLNRTTMVTSIVYTDSSMGGSSPVNLQFTAAACDVGNW
jgi:hypothetical protein